MEIIKQDDQTDILDETTLAKYSLAAQFTNKVIAEVCKRCGAGASTAELCSYGDGLIQDYTSSVYKASKYEKGIAEPTTINVNNCLSGYAPVDSPFLLEIGNVVKVSLGVHVDGYTAKACHTVVVTPIPATGPLISRPADAFCAAFFATEAVVKLLGSANDAKPVTPDRIRALVDQTAQRFQVKVAEGSRVRRIKRFLVGQAKVEEDAVDGDAKKSVEWVYSSTFTGSGFIPEDGEWAVEQGEAWLVDIAMTTGAGKVKEHTSLRPTIFVRDVTVTYNLKLKAAQQTLREIERTKSVFPFSIRSLSDARTAKLGVSECVNKGLLAPYPVLVEHPKATIARQAATVLVHGVGSSDIIRLTGGSIFKLPWVKSDFEIEPNSDIDLWINHSQIKVKETGLAPELTSKMQI